jgi:4-hydroxythreonine-4-phosphate dehydrogenase
MKIIITQGDSNGIGLEVAFKALKYSLLDKNADVEYSLCGNLDIIKEYAQAIHDPIEFADNCIKIYGRSVPIINCETKPELKLGQTDAIAGKLAGEAIDKSIDLVLSGEYDALVTMPISKDAMNLGGYNYTGHTEFLAKKCAVENPLMILASEDMKVALVTIHIPISSVSSSINESLLHRRFGQLYYSLRNDYAIKEPQIAVLSLNPHAGEAGRLGAEEKETIIPAMQSSKYGKYLHGPFSADGFFAHKVYKKYDGIIAMYHDQGLIPLKMLAEGGGVNFTAGLPIIRTSPDHGSAFDVAGKGIAQHQSALQAIAAAKTIYENRKSAKG